ncbi:PhzF family phenazine biosynthesis protein [Kocuria rosea]|uniref:Phenazine biosynthesis protein PhzF n=1 Tax=Kocuria rosea subsp. polaris TaxID=136273 RepID=A0A0A6VX76_KOCRO|nr:MULTISPECIES: PhzF family phenazine biosynthesis protein [Kocuria]KHD98818.1 phenazine biosynthesis protein PhzF [Kocuria polaris]WIG16845.1 PhzF family phenazine biosynthesis protein [Kocuria rosea]
MTSHAISWVDVFSPAPLGGNPLAVVHGADALDEDTMARFARWTNLSETTFQLEPTVPGADYRVRIFTPGGELPFAGHPTLGTASAWLALGGEPAGADVVQECGVGLVTVRRREGRLSFAAPPLTRYEPVTEPALLDRVARSLRLDPSALLDVSWLDNGPGWIGVRVADAGTVLGVRADWSAMAGLKLGVVGPHPEGAECAVEVRAFVGDWVVEDPVTGSLNAGLARWLTDNGWAPERYVAAQGTVLGRTGRVLLERDAETVWVGGQVSPVVRGTVEL